MINRLLHYYISYRRANSRSAISISMNTELLIQLDGSFDTFYGTTSENMLRRILKKAKERNVRSLFIHITGSLHFFVPHKISGVLCNTSMLYNILISDCSIKTSTSFTLNKT